MSESIEKRGIELEFNADQALRGQEKWNRAQDKAIRKNEEHRDSVVKDSEAISRRSAAIKQGTVPMGALASRTGKLTKESADLAKQFYATGASVKELAETFSVSEKTIRNTLGLQKEQIEIEKQAERQRVKLTAAEQLWIRQLEARTRAAVQLSKERVANTKKETAALRKRNEEERVRRLRPTVLAPVVTTEFRAPPTDEQDRLAAAVDRTTGAVRRQDQHLGRLLKKTALWAIGLRSVWFAYIRVRRAIVQAVREVFENTEEADKLSEAWANLKDNMVLALIPFDDARESMSRMADLYDDLAQSSADMADATAGDFAAGAEAITTLGEKSAEAAVLVEGFLAILPPGVGEVTQALLGLGVRAGVLGSDLQEAGEGAAALARKNSELQREAGLTASALDEETGAADRLRDSLFSIQERGLRRLLEAEQQYQEDSAQLWIDHEEEINDIIEDGWERRDEIALNGMRRMAAITRQMQDRQAAIDRQLNRRLQDIELQAQVQSERNAFNHRQRMLDIERRYRDKLRDIERKFSDTLADAIARRDATAALKAIRERRRGLEDAGRERDEARSDASTDYNQQSREQTQRLEEQRQAARRAHARQLEDLEIARAQQERELRISLEQQVEDLQRSLEDQEQELEDSFDKQWRELRDHFSRDRRERELQNAVDRALATNEYTNRENAYAAHLGKLRIIRAQFSAESSFAINDPRGLPGYAQGGQFIASGTTPFVAGEGASPEMVTITPLGAGRSGSVSHSISGSVTHDIDVAISRSIGGMEGRISAAIQRAMGDLLR